MEYAIYSPTNNTMDTQYEITIRELRPFTEDEIRNLRDRTDRNYDRTMPFDPRFSDSPHHTLRVAYVVLTKEQVEAVKKAIIGVF